MIVEIDKSFIKSLEKIKDKSIYDRVEKAIEILEKTDSLENVINIKKLKGFKNFYRIRVGDYRIGFELIQKRIILLIIISHRKDIYKFFP